MTATLPAIDFTPPAVAPTHPLGLAAATTWAESSSGEALRWLSSGVQFRLQAHRPSSAFGVWGADWCADPDDLDPEDDVKGGPAVVDDDPDAFAPMTVWAFDRLQECGNLTEFDRAEVRIRAEQTFALSEPIAAETEFATRALADAGTPDTAADLVLAVGALEESFAATGTVGLIHARPGLLAVAENLRMIIRDPAQPDVLRTPAGHRWVFGAGYVTPLGDTLIGSTVTYGWRGPIETRDALQHDRNQYVVIVERSLVVGYEAPIGAVTITP